MKKLLGIVVLGLMLSGNAYADRLGIGEKRLDINFNCKTEGYLQITRALDDLGLTWFEIDLYDPAALRHIRNSVQTPIASCESLFRLREFRPFFENHYFAS